MSDDVSSAERVRWNDRYRDADDYDDPPGVLLRLSEYLPSAGRAVDVAGGRGTAAAYLASRGLDVTCADVSDIGLERARARGERLGLPITTMQVELGVDPFPEGPWDLITYFHHLDRSLFPAMIHALAPGGTLAVGIATMTNLERHQRPPARFLLNPGELPTLVGDLDIVHHHEGWNERGRHEAELVARR